MLTYQDCLGMCSLDQDEIDAIAEHERIPEIVALEYAEYVIHRADGVRVIRHIIFDDIRHAESCGDFDHAVRLRASLRHFIATHPERRATRAAGAPSAAPIHPAH